MAAAGTPSISKSSSARVPAIMGSGSAVVAPDPGREFAPAATVAGAGRSSAEPAELACVAPAVPALACVVADPGAVGLPDEENRLASQLIPEDNTPGDSLSAAPDVAADEVDVGLVAGCAAGAGVAPGAGVLPPTAVGAAAIFSGAVKKKCRPPTTSSYSPGTWRCPVAARTSSRTSANTSSSGSCTSSMARDSAVV